MIFLNLMFEIKEITPSPFHKSAKSEEREREGEYSTVKMYVQYISTLRHVFVELRFFCNL